MPRREQQTVIATVAPRSCLFFIVADVGPRLSGPGASDSAYRPLAITYRQGRAHGPGRTGKSEWQRVQQVAQDCARIIDSLTKPGNRAIMAAEIALARAEYRRSSHIDVSPRTQVPDRPQPNLCDAIVFHGESPEANQIPPYPASPTLVNSDGRSSIIEYPFTSTCVRLALCRLGDETGATFEDVREQPLSTIYPEHTVEYSAIVIDISDLNAVKYGILSPRIRYVAACGSNFGGTFGWDPIESEYYGPPPELHLETSGSRSPLSVTAYMSKFGLEDRVGSLDTPNARDDINPSAVECILSLEALSPMYNKQKISGSENEEIRRILSLSSSGGLNLVDGYDIISSPDSQNHLREYLLENCEQLKDLDALVQLLRLAYAGRSDLHWLAYRHMSYNHIARALGSNELRSAQVVSICIEDMTGDPMPLLEVLATHKTIRDISFLEGSSRTSDDKSTHLFAQICASPFAAALLTSKNIFITGAFSAPLRRETWLRDPDTGTRLDTPALRSAFPVLHMFVRQQFLPVEEVHRVDPETTVWPGWKMRSAEGEEEEKAEVPPKDTMYRPCHFFVGDALLSPQRFAIGFLQYCKSVLDDRYLVSFASTPSRANISSSAGNAGPLGPLPAETLAIPENVILPTPSNAALNPSVECWPLFGPLEPGGWVALVSYEWHTTSKIRQLRRDFLRFGLPSDSSIGVPVVRYALLRAKERISLAAGTSADSLRGKMQYLKQLASPEYIDKVCGITEFLQQTDPTADHGLVALQLKKTLEVLRTRWHIGQGSHRAFPSDMDLVVTLDDTSAREMFQDFLADAVHIKDNLISVQQAHAPRHQWYPRMQSLDLSGVSGKSRDDKVFKHLGKNMTAGGAKPLGTTRPVQPPEIVPGPIYPEPGEESSTWINKPTVVSDRI
ncbi:hypothetical protein HJFPF1_06037 [Paramyrothecium foliicola]|nr:hypothetical protein HJFPF1_06037 [Paramyrothecium foliicola]